MIFQKFSKSVSLKSLATQAMENMQLELIRRDYYGEDFMIIAYSFI